MVVIQDLVTPEETEAVFRASGLYNRAYTWEKGYLSPRCAR